MTFGEKLAAAWASSGSMLCVGLDPDGARMPAPLGGAPDAIERFCCAIVDATADLVCAYKPQIAHFSAQRAEATLEAVCGYIRDRHPDVPILLDAKRGDIGSTAEFYAREVFGRYGADAVTYNPYLGTDAAEPLLDRGAVFAICRTSNPGSGELQDLDAGGRPVYERVAEMVATRWTQLGECGLVVGATYPEQLRSVRQLVGDLPILVPGAGAQGGDVAASVDAGATAAGTGLLVSSSRAVLYASAGEDFAEAARAAAEHTGAAINAARPRSGNTDPAPQPAFDPR
jgi:orotidine-5'-phosphate decarboxylase